MPGSHTDLLIELSYLASQFLPEKHLNLTSHCSKGGTSQNCLMFESLLCQPSFPYRSLWVDTCSSKEVLSREPGS